MGGRAFRGGGWANVKVGNAGGTCRSRTWATEEGGQKQNKTKKKVKEREEGEKEYILIEYKAIFTILFKKKFLFFFLKRLGNECTRNSSGQI